MRGAALLLTVALAGCASSSEGARKLPSGPVPLRYVAYDGGRRSLSALHGQPVVVSMVATWAGAALIEVERLLEVRRETDGAFALVVLVLDDEPTTAAVFADTFEIPELVGRVEDRARFEGEDGPFGPIAMVPTTVLLDAGGSIALRSDGPLPEGVLQEALQKLAEAGRAGRRAR